MGLRGGGIWDVHCSDLDTEATRQGFSDKLVLLRTWSHPDFARTAHVCSAFLQSLLQLRDWTASMLCSPSDLPTKGFSNQIPLVTRGNCTFYEKVRLAQGSGAHGLLIVSKETLVWPPGCPSWAAGTLGNSRTAGPTRGKGWRWEEPKSLRAVGTGAFWGLDSHSWGRQVGGDKFGLLTMAVDLGLWTLVLEGACPRAVLGFGGYRASGWSSGSTF